MTMSLMSIYRQPKQLEFKEHDGITDPEQLFGGLRLEMDFEVWLRHECT